MAGVCVVAFRGFGEPERRGRGSVLLKIIKGTWIQDRALKKCRENQATKDGKKYVGIEMKICRHGIQLLRS